MSTPHTAALSQLLSASSDMALVGLLASFSNTVIRSIVEQLQGQIVALRQETTNRMHALKTLAAAATDEAGMLQMLVCEPYGTWPDDNGKMPCRATYDEVISVLDETTHAPQALSRLQRVLGHAQTFLGWLVYPPPTVPAEIIAWCMGPSSRAAPHARPRMTRCAARPVVSAAGWARSVGAGSKFLGRHTNCTDALVAWTWLSDTVHQGLILSLEYSTLITHFGDLAPIGEINTEVILQGFFTIFVSVPVQFFFLHRIWRLSVLVQSACIVLETVTGLTYLILPMGPNATPASILVGTKRATGIVYLITAASVDVIIAICMVYLLWSAKSHGLTQTRRMITRLIVYSVNTGMWTALLAVFCAMTMIAYPTTFVFIGLYMPISALYCNTLLANLNVRHHVRGGTDDFSLSGIPTTTINFRRGTTDTPPAGSTVDRSTTAAAESHSEVKYHV